MKDNVSLKEIARRGVNFTTLAREIGISDKTLRRQVRVMLEDPKIKEQFGEYRIRRLTAKQLELIARNIPHVAELIIIND